MKRPSKFDGEGKSLAGDLSPSPSAGPPGSSRLIPFPVAAAAKGRDTEGAGVSSASVPSFVPLSVPIRAVVMRLQGKFPRIRVERATEGDFAARSDDRSAAWEEEDQR